MAIVHHVAGAATIRVDTGGSNALEDLGYTRDGAMVRFDGFFLDIPCDLTGGENGPPSDIQFLGETALITCDFTKFDETIATKIRSRRYGIAEGQYVPADIGKLMIGSTPTLTFRVVIDPAIALPLNFPICVFREPFEINKGTKYSTWRVECTAYRSVLTDVLYNAVDT